MWLKSYPLQFIKWESQYLAKHKYYTRPDFCMGLGDQIGIAPKVTGRFVNK